MKKITIISLLLMFMGFFGVANAATITYSIQDGATMEEFDGVFTITIEGATDIEVTPYKYFYLYAGNSEGSTKMKASCEAMFDKATNVFTVTFPSYNMWPDYPIQTNGDYCIMIPAGLYKLDGTENVQEYVDFTIDAPRKYITMEDVTIDPAPCKFEEMIPQITITLPEEVTSVDFNEVAAGSSDYYGKITAKAQFGSVYNGQMNSPVGEYDIAVEGNKLILTPSETLEAGDLREGEWGVRILRNSMYFNGDKTKTNDILLFAPYVYPRFLKMMFTPESGSKIIDMSKFVAKIDGVTAVADESIVSTLSMLNTESDQYEYVCDMTVTTAIKQDSWGYDYTEVVLTPNTSATLDYGKYKIEMPKGAVKSTADQPDLSAPTTLEYEYIEMPQISLVPTWSIDEGGVVTQFTEVTMTFAEATQIDYVGQYNYDAVISINEVVDGVATPWGGNMGFLDVEITGNQVRLYMDEGSFYPNYPIDKDGEYRVIVPKGKFAFEGVETYTNEELVLNFKVDAPDPAIPANCATIDPAPSIVADMAGPYTITLDGVEGEITVIEVTEEVYDYNTGEYVQVTGPAKAQLMINFGGYYMQQWGSYDIAVDGNKLTLTPDEAMQNNLYFEPSDYQIVIPKGVLIVDNDPNKTNARLEFGWYTIERVIKLTFVEPEPQAVVEKLSTFTLSSDAYSTPTTIDNSLITIAKLDETTGEYTVLDNAIEATAAMGPEYLCDFTLNLAQEITEAGKYKVTVDKSAFFWDEYMEDYGNAEIEGVFEVKGAITPEQAFAPIAVDPEEGDVKSIKDITITFDNQYFANGLWCEDNAEAKVYNEAEEVIATADIVADAADAKITISFAEEICSVGTFDVVIEQGMISDYDNPEFLNPEIRLTYNIEVSGIDAVEKDAKVLTVVSINGVVVKENASWNEISNLENGVYIVNGQKVLVRK